MDCLDCKKAAGSFDKAKSYIVEGVHLKKETDIISANISTLCQTISLGVMEEAYQNVSLQFGTLPRLHLVAVC